MDFGAWKDQVLGLLGFGSWKWISGPWKGQVLGPGRGLWVLEGDCGSWKGQVLRPGRGGFWVLKGSGFEAWKGQVLGPGRVRF